MLTGWQDTDGRRFARYNGAMKTGWYKKKLQAQSNANTSTTTNTTKTVNWYYLNSDGSMKTGWFLDGGKWYYLNTNGTNAKGMVNKF